MKVDNKYLELYAITDRHLLKECNIEDAVLQAIRGGVTCIQLREKNCSDKEFINIALKVKQITDRFNIPLIINDNIDVCLAVNAFGVHIGQDDSSFTEAKNRLGKDKIIGVSVTNYQEAHKAFLDGADYIGVGAMFKTDTKKDAKIVKFSVLEDITSTLPIPVVVIGGINSGNISEFANIDIKGICVISDIFGSDNIYKSTKKLKELTELFINKLT